MKQAARRGAALSGLPSANRLTFQCRPGLFIIDIERSSPVARQCVVAAPPLPFDWHQFARTILRLCDDDLPSLLFLGWQRGSVKISTTTVIYLPLIVWEQRHFEQVLSRPRPHGSIVPGDPWWDAVSESASESVSELERPLPPTWF